MMSEKKEITQKRINVTPHRFLYILIFVTLTLIFALLTVFFTGRAIAGGDGESVSFYLSLRDSKFDFLIPVFFGDGIPSLTPDFPPPLPSDPSAVMKDFFSDSDELKRIEMEKHVLFAINDPLRLKMGKTTQLKNHLSGILKLTGASIAFSSADEKSEKVLVYEGKEEDTTDGGFLGVTKDGVVVFGVYPEYEGELWYATAADCHTLISGGVPSDFTPSTIPMDTPAMSIGQCADGTLLIAISRAGESVSSIAGLMYRYGAVNAILLFHSPETGFALSDGEIKDSDAFSSTRYGAAWIIK